jgi:hypothetical protein
MALFTDGILNRESDLQDRESSILSVAALEGVDTLAKRILAQEDIGNQLRLFLLRDPWLDPKRLQRRSSDLCDVVDSALLKQWHAELSIALTYSDAYSNQLNDRYLAKWTQYKGLARETSIRYLQTGVELVYDPVPKAICPTLTAVNGEVSSAIYFFALTWQNATEQEGEPSDVVSLTCSAGSVPMLAMMAAPSNAVGWNIYGGLDPKVLALQYSGALPTPLSWTMPVSGLILGRPPGCGQLPELFVVDQRRIQRG